MASKKKAPKQSFDEFFGDLWQDRWPDLRNALLNENESCEISRGLTKPYFLDRASTYPVKALDIDPSDRVLDLCAAPGGKSLLIARELGSDGSLVSNDRSATRRDRLKRVLAEHLDAERAQKVEVTGHDATRWGVYQKATYDKVLLDAPCSSERHVLHSPRHLDQWTPARTKHLSVQAFAMLAAALDAVKPGGRVVYSTCTISRAENDDVLAKLFKKRPGLFDLERGKWDLGEPTEHGWIILPDRCKGAGPMYFASIRRTP